MASKKVWKARAREFQAQLETALARADEAERQIAVIHNCFRDVEFPGPTLQEWAYQLRDFALRLHRVVKWSPPDTIVAPAARRPTSIEQADAEGDGTFTLPTEAEVLSHNPLPDPSQYYKNRGG